MPHTIEMSRKTVILNEKNKAVVTAFNDALKEKNAEKSQLFAGEKRTRKGLWSIVAKVEDLAQTNLSAKECELARIEVLLDPPAKSLWDDYTVFLNALVKEDGVQSDEIAGEVISNHHVLIREILLRIAVDALSENMLDDHDGDKLMEVMKSFIKHIKKQPKLVMDGFFIVRLTNTARALVTSHDDWILCLNQMVSAIKLLHANKTVTSQALNLLEKTRLTIIRQLIAELTFEDSANKEVKAERLIDGLAPSTLVLLEDAMIQYRIKDTKALIEVSELPLQQRPLFVIECIKDEKDKVTPSTLKDNTSKRKNVKALYDFLHQTKLLLDIVAQIDALNSTTGWIAIMTGAVKLDNLANLLREHAKRCNELLKVSPTAKALSGGKNITFGLVSFDATTGSELSRLAYSTAGQFECLQKSDTLNQLLNYIKHTIARLIELQNQLPQPIDLVDKQVCEKLITDLSKGIKYVAGSSSGPASALPAAEQDRRVELIESSSAKHTTGSGRKAATSLPVIENSAQGFIRNLVEEDGNIEIHLRKIPVGNSRDLYVTISERYRKVNSAILSMNPSVFSLPTEAQLQADETWLNQQRSGGKNQQDAQVQKYIFDQIQLLSSNDYDMDTYPLKESIRILDEKNYILVLKKMSPELRQNYAAFLSQFILHLRDKLKRSEDNYAEANSSKSRLGSETSVQKRFDEHIKLLKHLIEFVQNQIGLAKGEYKGSDSKIYNVDNCSQNEWEKIINVRYMMRFAEELTKAKMASTYLDLIDRVNRECINDPELALNGILTVRIARAKEISSHIKQCSVTVMGILNSNHPDDAELKSKLRTYQGRTEIQAPGAAALGRDFPPRSAEGKPALKGTGNEKDRVAQRPHP